MTRDEVLALPPGAPVLWLREQRGGYGFVDRIRARKVRVGKVRVTIRLEDFPKELSVDPKSLRAVEVKVG